MNVHDFKFIYDDLAFINDAQAKKLINVTIQEFDILFNITGVSVARCCIVPKNILPARVNQHVMVIRPFSELDFNFYLLLFLTSTEIKNMLLGLSQSGSTREAITKSDIENVRILIPKIEILSLFNNQIDKCFSFISIKTNQNEKLNDFKSLLLSRLATLEEDKLI